MNLNEMQRRYGCVNVSGEELLDFNGCTQKPRIAGKRELVLTCEPQPDNYKGEYAFVCNAIDVTDEPYDENLYPAYRIVWIDIDNDGNAANWENPDLIICAGLYNADTGRIC